MKYERPAIDAREVVHGPPCRPDTRPRPPACRTSASVRTAVPEGQAALRLRVFRARSTVG